MAGQVFATKGNLIAVRRALKQAQLASARWIDTEGTADTPEGIHLRRRIGELFRRAEGTMN